LVHLVGMTLAYFAVFSVTLITILLFTLLTRYNDWEEIAKGNMAASMALGGKVFGVANIVHFAVRSNDTMMQTGIWGLIGLLLLLVIYQVFEWITPKLNINNEIASGNKAVGFMSMIFSISFSFVIGASIS